MTRKKQTIALITTTRADWGILSRTAHMLHEHPSVHLVIGAGNMHLSHKFGHTVDEILAAGFSDIFEMPCPEVGTTASSRTKIVAAMATNTAALIDKVNPDAIIILGDRYEMMGVATAALIAGVPIVHLHGGEISEGAIDGAIRDAISKMATLHLTSTPMAAKRLITMGEEPKRVVVTGSLGVENALSTPLLSRDDLLVRLDGFDINPEKTLLITFHPVTNHPDKLSTKKQIDNLTGALSDVEGWNAIITYPNNDTDSDIILDALKQFAGDNPGRVFLTPSLGMRCYLSAMHLSKAVVGNTSSGIIEAPSTPAYTINIGPRQQGRECATDIIHVADDRAEIGKAVKNVLAMPSREAIPERNPYYKPGSSQTVVDAIVGLLPKLSRVKKFYWSDKS
ncbi:MAG: UDP-N-acetylglucosamine 2-epimerase (hydrolyzing) [Muribaculaceae bacterium]|nr:UDP-N-acetylglucosamine 2-epimerase (hydrolyzing) [Muribaculaceae bacterium]